MGRPKKQKIEEQPPYSAMIPQIIDSTGKFLNNVKKPFFVWGVLALGVITFAMHLWTSKVGTLYDVLAEQNKLTQENNELRAEQNSLLKELNENCSIAKAR